jgi:hypothetical protein
VQGGIAMNQRPTITLTAILVINAFFLSTCSPGESVTLKFEPANGTVSNTTYKIDQSTRFEKIEAFDTSGQAKAMPPQLEAMKNLNIVMNLSGDQTDRVVNVLGDGSRELESQAKMQVSMKAGVPIGLPEINVSYKATVAPNGATQTRDLNYSFSTPLPGSDQLKKSVENLQNLAQGQFFAYYKQLEVGKGVTVTREIAMPANAATQALGDVKYKLDVSYVYQGKKNDRHEFAVRQKMQPLELPLDQGGAKGKVRISGDESSGTIWLLPDGRVDEFNTPFSARIEMDMTGGGERVVMVINSTAAITGQLKK